MVTYRLVCEEFGVSFAENPSLAWHFIGSEASIHNSYYWQAPFSHTSPFFLLLYDLMLVNICKSQMHTDVSNSLKLICCLGFLTHSKNKCCQFKSMNNYHPRK